MRNALGYLAGSEDAVKTVLVGGFLWYFGNFLVIPNLFVFGYLVRVIRHAAAGEPDPPRFEEWRGLLVDGAKAYAIWGTFTFLLVGNYTLIADLGNPPGGALAFASFVLGGGSVLLFLVPYTSGVLASNDVVLQSAATDTWLLYLLILYVAPVGIANFADRRSLRAGFSFSNYRAHLIDGAYATRWPAFLALWAASTWLLFLPFASPTFDQLAVAVADSTLPVVGLEVGEYLVLASHLASFYLLVSAYVVVGRAWRTTHEEPTGESDDAADATATPEET